MDLSQYRLEALRQDEEFILYRCLRQTKKEERPQSILALAPVMERPAPATIKKIEHEFSLKDELDPAWAVRPLALAQYQGRAVLILEDKPGEPLERLLDIPSVSRALAAGRSAEPAVDLRCFLRLAVGLAGALSEMHRRGIIHKDVKPAHVLVNAATGQVWLTGLGIASRLPRERQTPDPPETIAGTLAYMAPEQTGRMNRSIDCRSDLYALGVTLYQMLTGSLPFSAAEPIEWVHCHIARQPIATGERVVNVPAPVSAIIMKLLAKMGEERYQTAAGLERDLWRCLAQWEAERRIDDFPLGEDDTPDRLLIPERLYGRAREVETLLAAFDRVVNGGAPELVLVSGYSGIGKSSVVNELQPVLVPPRAFFAAGKFDQYKRDIPYSTLAQAFQSLVRSLLAKSNVELGAWREALREALGPNGQLMADLVPELELIIGDQASVPELPPQDAQRRFQLVLRRFLAVFARSEHPLALFLDDLQWLDAATLDLLEDLLTHTDVRHVLLIGAYRDNEVTSAHPLMRTLDRIRSAGAAVRDIVLAPLAREHLGELIADSLRCDRERAAPLVELAQQKTAGNPFFVIQFLSALVEQGLLTFDHEAAQWAWDLARIHGKGYTDNVVDLMVAKLSRLPIRTQKSLQLLACLGNSAEFARLAMVHEDSNEELRRDLQEALRSELVLHADGSYRFLHDRVQEAAYSLIPEKERAVAHLRIGRLLMAHIPAEKREEAIFEIVNQLNRGAALITSREEKEQLAGLNLIAGKRAKTSTAYTSALKYLVAATSLLSDDGWERRPDLMFVIELSRAECEFLTGEQAAAETRLTTLSLRAASPVDQATVACLRVDLYTTLNQNDRAVDVCLAYLHRLGIECSPHPTEEEARREYDRTWSLLGGRDIEELIDLPVMSDPAVVATLDVLTKALTPALYTNANLMSLIVCQMINLSLEHGNTDGSCLAYVWLGRVAGYRFGNYQAGFRFGLLGYNLVERSGLERFKARTYISFGNFCMAWAKPVRAGREMIRRAFDAATTHGDLTHGAFSYNNLIANLLAAGDPLVDVQREAERGLAFAHTARFGAVIDLITTQLAFIRTLRGLTATFGCLNDAQFDELQFERSLSSGTAPGAPIAACRYWIRKLQARFLAGDYTAAVDASGHVQRLLWTTPSVLEVAEGHFYGALSHAASCDAMFPVQYRRHVEALTDHHKQLAEWAENCPENFENRALLVGAEIARIEGRELDAERLYEAAIRSARENHFVQNEALANELAARFYAARGFETISQAYLRNARYGYLRWGADGKVRQLDQLYPHLKTEEAAPVPAGTIDAPLERLDLATVIKVSQAISGEIVLEKLLDTVMRKAMEHAGAERGLLILSHGAQLQVNAEATTAGDSVRVRTLEEPISSAAVPESVLRYVVRTQEHVIIHDASVPNSFSTDEYFREKRNRSVACLPLLKQGELVALLYIENTLASNVFTPARLKILEVLASQAAISIENSRLYHEIQRAEEKLRQDERELKKAEEALRANERNLRQITDVIPTLIHVLRTDGSVLYVNQAVLDFTGLTLEEARQEDYRARVFHPEDVERLWEERREALTRAVPFENEQRVLNKDGKYRWFLCRYNPLLDEQGRIDRWYAAAFDIEDRKRAEAQVEQAYLRLAEAQRLSKTGSFITDIVADDHNWSEEAFRIFEFDPAAKVTVQMIRDTVHPEDLPTFDAVIARGMTGTDVDFVFRVVTSRGAVKHVRGMARVIAQIGGRPLFIGALQDVTESKVAEEALNRARSELAHMARVTTLSALTASIAHEINQPIAAAITSAGACLRWLNRDQPEVQRAREAAMRIEEDGKRAAEIITHLKSFYKKDVSPQREMVSVNALVGEMLVLLRSEANRHSVVTRTELAADVLSVSADRVLLQQVLMNLMLNGMEAMSERGGELKISARREGGDVMVSVSDTGVGIPADKMEQIFNAYVTTKAGGTGMGLAISRTIIESHGGRLWATVNPGRGATFHFTLPIEPEAHT